MHQAAPVQREEARAESLQVKLEISEEAEEAEKEEDEDEEEDDEELDSEEDRSTSGKRRSKRRRAEDGMSGAENCCAGCRAPIRDKFIFSVIDLHWHQDCVRCVDCALKLDERCHTLEGKLYCKLDYWRRFGPKCFGCRETIEPRELVQKIMGNRVYHLKCFTCAHCNKQLRAGEQLHLIEGKRLLCNQDYELGLVKFSQPAREKNLLNGFGQRPDLPAMVGERSQQVASKSQSTKSCQMLDKSSSSNNNQLTVQESAELEELDEELDEDDDDELDEFGIGQVDDDDLDGDELDSCAGQSVRQVRALLDYQLGANQLNNMEENEENNSFGSAPNHPGLANAAGRGCSKKSMRQQQQQSMGASNAKRKRRRKQQQKLDAFELPSARSKGSLVMSKKLASRNGESILNGCPPAASILASVHPSSLSQQMQVQVQVQTQQHQHQQQQQLNCQLSGNPNSNSNNNKSVSSSASTASNSSSSNSSLAVSHRVRAQSGQQSMGGPGQSGALGQQGVGGGHKPTRVRTVLNEKQLQTLRDCYAHNPRPDALMKEQLVDLTGLSPRVIRVWFQNKRCKDKKKSILYKQMQQHEKDGRHLAGLTLMRGVPMVASSPIQYDDHSTVSSTAGNAQQQQQTSQVNSALQMLELQPAPDHSAGPPTEASPQRLSGQHYNSASLANVHSPNQMQPVDIHAYQPPWKNLIEYAHHSQQPNQDRLNAQSPRYQRLINQIHGFGASSEGGNCEQSSGGAQTAMDNQQQQQVSGCGQFSDGQQQTSVNYAALNSELHHLNQQQHQPHQQHQQQLTQLHQFQH